MSDAKRFFITTPIYYANAPVHLGHAYTSIACDVLARWHRLKGDDVFFLTGLDEHGGNIEKVAKEHGVEPQALCDDIAKQDLAFFGALNISNDDFIRTTEDRHRKATDAFWEAVAKGTAPDGKPNLYKGTYEGLYCSKCEGNYTEENLKDGNCPVHGTPVEKLSEESYFFHLSGYQTFLDAFFDAEEKKPAQDRFVVPDTRFNEVRGILREGLRDISVSRTKVKWGFPVPGDPSHVIYVWFDALINYLTALGYPDTASPRWKFWPADMHVMGKEIIRFHTLLWPAMLEAAKLPLPRKIVVQGWWTVEGQKISKSLGNVIDPRTFAEKYGLDAVRHFLLSEIAYGADGDFSEKRFVERYNTDLANIFGNLSHRTIAMSHKYFAGKIPFPKDREISLTHWLNRPLEDPSLEADGDKPLLDQVMKWLEPSMSIPQPQAALNQIWELARAGNKYIDDRAPWKQEPDEQQVTLGNVLVLLEALSWPLLAFIPGTGAKLRERLGLPVDKRVPLPAEFNVIAGDPLFPRVDTKKKV